MDPIICTATCPNCGGENTVRVPLAGYKEWKSGTFIQRALPELSDAEREILLSGTCPKCWDDMFEIFADA